MGPDGGIGSPNRRFLVLREQQVGCSGLSGFTRNLSLAWPTGVRETSPIQPPMPRPSEPAHCFPPPKEGLQSTH